MSEGEYRVKFGKYEVTIPHDLFYTENHLWLKPVNGTLRIGVTDPQVKLLGGIIVVDFQVAEGEKVSKEDVCVVLEAYKTTSNLESPLPGKILNVNGQLSKKTRTVETDPYNEGWFLTLEPENAGSSMEECTKSLLDAHAYHALILKEAEGWATGAQT